MKSIIYKILPFIFAAVALQGCLNTDFEEEIVPDDAVVTFSLSSGSYVPVKSSFGWGEKEIRTAQIVVTDADGTIMDDLWTSNGGSLSFRGVTGNTYYAWAAVNLGERVVVNSLSDFTSGTRSVSYSAINSTGIPMFSDGGVQFTVGNGNSVTIDLTRMLARIDFCVDLEDIKKGFFTVESLDLYNAVSSYTPFEDSVIGDGSDGSFDSAGTYDLATLNNGGVVTLYAFENMQGNLLSGNDDPWEKVPENLGSDASKCTYLEMTASYSCQGLSVDEITYRMYLGSNATTNFDVRRNTKYEVTLYPSEDEIIENEHNGSWKIEVGDWNDARSLTFEQHTLTMFALDTDKSVGIIKSPDDLEYEFSYDETDAASAGIAVTHTGDLVSLVSSVDLDEERSLTLYVRTLDGVKHDECVVTVKPRVVLDHIEITPADASISVGGTQEYVVVAYYSDGTEVVVTDDAVIVSSNPEIAGVDGNVAEGLSHGTVTITASYEGEEAEATLVVSDVVTCEYELTAEADPTSIDVGGTTSLTGTLTRFEVVNGVRSGVSETVSGVSLTWHSDDSGVVSVNSSTKLGTGVSKGTADVWCTCTYEGQGYESDRVEITVNDVITYEYEIIASADPESINIGDDTELSAVLVEYELVNGTRSGESRNVSGVVFDWSSSNTGVLELSGDTGTGKAEGTADVTASCSYNGQSIESDPVTVTVSNGVASTVTMWGEITFTLNAGDDAPAKGGDTGECSVSDVRQETWTRTYYLDGTYTDGSHSYVSVNNYTAEFSKSKNGSYAVSGVTYHGSNLGTTVKDRTILGTVWAYVEANGESSDKESVDVYQEHNIIERTDEISRVPNAKQYGSWEVVDTDDYVVSNSYYVSIDADDYTSVAAAAPASGGSTSLEISSGHREYTVTYYEREWTQTAMLTERDTYTSTATKDRQSTVAYDSGTESDSEEGDPYNVEDNYTVSGSATGFTRSGTTVSIASEGTTVNANGRSVTYTVKNSKNTSVTDAVTIYQEPNVIEETIPGHNEYRNYVISVDPDSFGPEGGNGDIDGTYEWRYLGDLNIYTSGATNNQYVGTWYDSSSYPDDIIMVSGDNSLSFYSHYYWAIVPENTGSARSWSFYGTVTVDGTTLTSNTVTITQDEGSVVTYELVVSPSYQTIGEDDTAEFTATYYTLTNGVRDSGRDVTSSASWSVRSGSNYVTNDGDGEFSWKSGPGSATIRATYNGVYDEGSISITAPAPVKTLVSLTASPSSILLCYANGWEDSFSFTAHYSDGTTEDVTGDVSLSVPGCCYALNNGTINNSPSPGSGTLSGSYTYGGVTRSASISVTSRDDKWCEGIGFEMSMIYNNQFDVTDITASIASHFSRSTSLSLTSYSLDYDSSKVTITRSGDSFHAQIKKGAQGVITISYQHDYGDRVEEEIFFSASN